MGRKDKGNSGQKKKQRKVRFWPWKFAKPKKKAYKLKSSVEHLWSSCDISSNSSGKSGEENEAFVLDLLQMEVNISQTSVPKTADIGSDISPTSKVNECMSDFSTCSRSGEPREESRAFVTDLVQIGDSNPQINLSHLVSASLESGNNTNEFMSEVSAANRDETVLENEALGGSETTCSQCFLRQETIQKLSDAVDRLSLEKEQQTLYEKNLRHMCMEMVKEKQILIEQCQKEIQQIRLTGELRKRQLEEEIRQKNIEDSALKEVNASLINRILKITDENVKLLDEVNKLEKKCTDFQSENMKYHQDLTTLRQKLRKAKQGQKRDKYSINIGNAKNVNVGNQNY